MAGDLRLALAILHINLHLERIADQCVNIAKLTKLSEPAGFRPQLVDAFVEMGSRAEQMLRVAMDSFANRDAERAETLTDLDELIDEENKALSRKVIAGGSSVEAQEAGPAGDADLALHRADRRQRGGHRRADGVPGDR